jgi:hypothetical protein
MSGFMATEATQPVWAVTPEKVKAAVRRLVEVAAPQQI